MSTLIVRGAVLDDPYAAVKDEDALPEGAVLISLARWSTDGAALREARRRHAVRLPNTVDVLNLDATLLEADALVLEFPGFADGRAYSQAHQLRERRHYRGEIRATGAAVVRDQILGMARCGIDACELRADQSPEACLDALLDFSRAYQPGVLADTLPRVRALRSA